MMISRRNFIRSSSVLASVAFMGCNAENIIPDTFFPNDANWFMPDESELHLRTWMAFATSADIWGVALLKRVQQDLVTIANTIAKYEPVSMLVQPVDMANARALLAKMPARTYPVTLIEAVHDDLWMRDTSCVFVKDKTDAEKKVGINFNFNGWGDKQKHDLDAKVAAFVANAAGVSLLNADLVLEGGGIEVNGHGTAIISESCILNPNRNPNMTKAQFEAKIKPLLGLDKIIWIPGILGKDITDGHTDFYARFASEHVVLVGYDSDSASYDHSVTLANIAVLEKATDAKGNRLQVVKLTAPIDTRETSTDFAAGYIGFYVCNGAVIAQQFGDANADTAARKALQAAFPNRVIEQLDVDAIALGGGSIHCTTQQEPA